MFVTRRLSLIAILMMAAFLGARPCAAATAQDAQERPARAEAEAPRGENSGPEAEDRDEPEARERWFRTGRTGTAAQSAAELRQRAILQRNALRARRAPAISAVNGVPDAA